MKHGIIYRKGADGGMFGMGKGNAAQTAVGGLMGGVQGGAEAVGIASMFNPNQKKADKWATGLYNEKGLMGDEAFEKQMKTNESAMTAYGQQANSLFAKKGSEVNTKNKNMILYKKAQNSGVVPAEGTVVARRKGMAPEASTSFGAPTLVTRREQLMKAQPTANFFEKGEQTEAELQQNAEFSLGQEAKYYDEWKRAENIVALKRRFAQNKRDQVRARNLAKFE